MNFHGNKKLLQMVSRDPLGMETKDCYPWHLKS